MATFLALLVFIGCAAFMLNLGRALFASRRPSAKRWLAGSAIVTVAAFGAFAAVSKSDPDGGADPTVAPGSREAASAASRTIHGESAVTSTPGARVPAVASRDPASTQAARTTTQDAPAPTQPAVASPPARCEIGEPMDVVAVNGSFELKAAPMSDAARLVNEKASGILGKTHYHSIDVSTPVRRLCVKSGWTEVQITAPEWLTFVRGWVPNDALRSIGRTRDGRRIYEAGDFTWDKDSAPFKTKIVAVINRISRENPNCAQLDTGTLSKSGSRSKTGDPVFFVACGKGARVFNVWFRPRDADGGAGFAPIPPIGRGDAMLACEKAAKDRSAHPSTVSFSKFLDLAYTEFPSGRAAVESSFTARNSFNLELKFRIRCLFDGRKMIEASIAEAR